MINANFNFHSIGQGCFYTGSIKLLNQNPNTFNFVYDCGSISKESCLDDEIYKLKVHLEGKSLDLLIISHFDEDHVNGVFKLLDGIKCKRLVIPYYEPKERLLIYTTSLSIDEDYRLMLQNPINFFSSNRFNIDEIILAGSPENDDNPNNENRPRLPLDKKPIEKFNDKTFETNYYYMDDEEKNEVIEKINNIENGKIESSKLKLLKKPYFLSIGIWEFIFYLKEHSNYKLIRKFTNDVNTILEKNKIGLKNLFEPDRIEELKKNYRKYFGKNLNSTSLVTYHGPLFNLKDNSYIHFHRSFNYCFRRCFHSNRLGTLLTGDINLSSKSKLSKMLDYFYGYIEQVCVFQVPHHGSKHNWNFKNPNGLELFCNYVINHGLGRKNHPSSEVVKFIKTNCTLGTLHLNNEIYNFSYGIR